MFGLFKKFKDYLEERKMYKICSSLELSEKGKCLIKYLEDIVAGEDVYVEAYEESIAAWMENGASRVEAAKLQLAVFKVLSIYGTTNIDINL